MIIRKFNIAHTSVLVIIFNLINKIAVHFVPDTVVETVMAMVVIYFRKQAFVNYPTSIWELVINAALQINHFGLELLYSNLITIKWRYNAVNWDVIDNILTSSRFEWEAFSFIPFNYFWYSCNYWTRILINSCFKQVIQLLNKSIVLYIFDIIYPTKIRFISLRMVIRQ